MKTGYIIIIFHLRTLLQKCLENKGLFTYKILNSAKREILITMFAHNKRSLESLFQGRVVSIKKHPDKK